MYIRYFIPCMFYKIRHCLWRALTHIHEVYTYIIIDIYTKFRPLTSLAFPRLKTRVWTFGGKSCCLPQRHCVQCTYGILPMYVLTLRATPIWGGRVFRLFVIFAIPRNSLREVYTGTRELYMRFVSVRRRKSQQYWLLRWYTSARISRSTDET